MNLMATQRPAASTYASTSTHARLPRNPVRRRRMLPREKRRIIRMHRVRDRRERVTLRPFAKALYDEAATALDVLLARRLINMPQRKPRHIRQVVMDQVVVVIQKQQAPEPPSLVDHRAMA